MLSPAAQYRTQRADAERPGLHPRFCNAPPPPRVPQRRVAQCKAFMEGASHFGAERVVGLEVAKREGNDQLFVAKQLPVDCGILQRNPAKTYIDAAPTIEMRGLDMRHDVAPPRMRA